jgi:hypothetical protein
VGWLEDRTIGGVEQMIVMFYVCKKTETKKKYITGQYCLLNMDDEKTPKARTCFVLQEVLLNVSGNCCNVGNAVPVFCSIQQPKHSLT